MKMNSKIYYTKPNLVSYLISLSASILHYNSNNISPTIVKNLGSYKLIEKIAKSHQFVNYNLGIYSNGKRKLFVKTWTGRFRNIHYYGLVNEIILSELISKHTSKLRPYNVFVPKIVFTTSSNNSLSVAFEYIEGKPLTTVNKNDQAKVISKVLIFLQTLSKKITSNEIKTLQKRNKQFYILSFYILLVFCMVENKQKYKLFLRVLFRSIVNPLDNNLQSGIVHRDINQENIIVKGSKIYLLDFEQAIYTLLDYDLTNVAIRKVTNKLSKTILANIKQNKNEFLYYHICLHNIFNYRNIESYKKYYLKMLENYE